jgi:hypothetical protein
MSKGPTGTGAKYAPTRHLNLKISKEDWCKEYLPGTLYCRIEQNIDNSLCLYCQFRRPLNIKGMLNDWEKENR